MKETNKNNDFTDLKNQKKICQEKQSSLVKLIEHIDKIKKTQNNNISVLNELNRDNKIILKELETINKKFSKLI
tara:strand:- start:65 stop:286 length:222 start_codon:yes stop_codon:yes gene_type:complete